MRTSRFILFAVSSLVVIALPCTATTIRVPQDQPTIAAGVDAAAYGDTVLVACGTYYEHGITVENGVTLRSEAPESHCAIIDAGGHSSAISCSGSKGVTIDGFTITNATRGVEGYYSSPRLIRLLLTANGTGSEGGGALCGYSSLVSHCVFSGNTGDSGAGLRCRGGTVVRHCEFLSNTSASLGGALRCTGAVTIEDCSFVSNSGPTGGAIYTYNARPTVNECTFSMNSAELEGGAVFTLGGPSHPVEFTNCVFTANSAGDGGAISTGGPPMVMAGCTFLGNSAESQGGAIRTLGGHVELSECKFQTGTASFGAGVYTEYSELEASDCFFMANAAAVAGGALGCQAEAEIVLTRCTLAENTGGYVGGGVYVGSPASVTAMNCTIIRSCALAGGGIATTGSASLTLENSIIAFCEDGASVACDDATSSTVVCCDIYGNTGGDWVACIADQSGLNGNICQDPLLCGDLSYGAPYALQVDSPCAPGNNPYCGLIGAWGVGCGPVAVEPTSWSTIKGMFR